MKRLAKFREINFRDLGFFTFINWVFFLKKIKIKTVFQLAISTENFDWINFRELET